MKTNFRKIALVIIGSFILFSSYAQDSLSFSIGLNSYAKGNVQDAIYWLSKSIEKNYLLADSYLYRGACKASLGNYDEAFVDLFYSYKLDSSKSLSCQFIGNIYGVQNKLDSSILWLSKAIKKDPKNGDAYSVRASTYKALKDYDKAMADINLAIKMYPAVRDFLLNRASIKQEQSNFDDALEDYASALAMDRSLGNNISTYINMAVCHAALNALEDALADFSKVLDRYPNEPQALEGRGQLYQAMGRKDEACADFKKLIPIDSIVANGYIDKYCR